MKFCTKHESIIVRKIFVRKINFVIVFYTRCLVIMFLQMKSLVTKRDKGQSEKIELPRENIDDRQENTILLPVVCKMRYIKRLHPILKTNEAGLYFLVCRRCFRGGNSIFSLWPLSRFVTKHFRYTLLPQFEQSFRYFMPALA